MKTLKQRAAIRHKIVYLAFLIFIFSSTVIFSDENIEIARLYLSVADSFYKEKKLDEAEIFLNKSMLYDDSLSDTYFLKALISKSTSTELNNSIAFLKKAITYRNWYIYRENSAFFELGKIYSMTKDHERALSSMYVIKDDFIDNQDYLDSYTLSLVNLGYFNESKELLGYAVEKYPQNTVFLKRLAAIDKQFRDRVLLRILDSNEMYKYDPDVLLEISRLSDDVGVKKELVQRLKQMEYNSPELVIEEAAINGAVKLSDIDVFFSSGGFSNYRNIKSILSLITENTIMDYLKEKYNEYSGYIKDDTNNDGNYEKIMFRAEGQHEWYSEDNNQDKVNDLFVGFQEGKPVFINIEEKMLAAYYEYPLVKTVILFGNDFNEIYNFNDRKAVFDILSFKNPFLAPVLVPDTDEMFSRIKGKAENYRKSTNGDNLAVLMEYFKSERIKNYESYDSVSAVVRRGIVKDQKVVFASGDINQDKLFETREIYRDGILESINYDGNNDGLYEFKLEKGIKYWDLNEDGIYDAREWTEKEKGFLYSEFSTNLDGVYNFMARYKGNTLTDINKNGEWIKVYYDRENNLYWIGDKRIQIKDKLTIAKEGIISVGSETVYIVKIGDNIFAEVID